jgi:hypothetical protein
LKANNRKYANGSDNRTATPVGPSADQRRKSPSGKGSGRRGKTPDGGKKKQGDCFGWINKGNCYKGDDCPFEHDDSKKGSGKSSRKNSRDGKKSSDGRGRSNSRNPKDKRSPSPSRPKTGQKYRGPTGTSPSGKEKREPCKNWLKGTCDKGKKCDFWHTGNCKHFAQGKCDRKDCIFKHPKKDRKASPAVDKAKEKKKKEKKKAKLAHYKGCIAKLEAESDEDEDDDQPEEETEGDQESDDSSSQQSEASASSAGDDSQDNE